MADALTREQLLQLARLGAEKRLESLRSEIRAIEALVGKTQSGGGIQRRGAERIAGGRTRRRPRWSAAKRKAAAERMKAYWAKRKANGKAKRK